MENTNKIKVAFFTDVLEEDHDGVTRTIYNIVKRIPDDKFEYIFITPHPPADESNFPYPIIPCRSFPLPVQRDYRIGFPYFDSKLDKSIEDFKPDIIHFTSPSFLGKYALKYASKNKIPAVSIFHTNYPTYMEYYFTRIPILKGFLIWFTHFVLRWFHNRCDLTYVPTSSIRDEIVGFGIEESNLMIWGRGINTKLFNPSRRDKKYIDKLCGEKTIRILFVSRILWIKGVKTLAGIYQLLEKKYPNVKMVITGDGSQEKYLKKNMPNAVFTGKLVGEELSRIYASCDIFVFPSVTETFGNVVLEALASGLPVVAASKGGQTGIVKDGETGFLAKPKNPEDFFHKISQLIDNPELIKKMSEKAAAYAESQKWEILCNEMFESYRNIISKFKK